MVNEKLKLICYLLMRKNMPSFKEMMENLKYNCPGMRPGVLNCHHEKYKVEILLKSFAKLEEQVEKMVIEKETSSREQFSLELKINTFHQTLDEYDEVIRRLHELLKNYEREINILKHENTKLKSEIGYSELTM